MNLEKWLGIWDWLVSREQNIVILKEPKLKVKDVTEDIKFKITSQTSKMPHDEIVNKLRWDTNFLKELINIALLPIKNESNKTVLISFLVKKLLELTNKKSNCITNSNLLKTLSWKRLEDLLTDIFNWNNFNWFEHVIIITWLKDKTSVLKKYLEISEYKENIKFHKFLIEYLNLSHKKYLRFAFDSTLSSDSRIEPVETRFLKKR